MMGARAGALGTFDCRFRKSSSQYLRAKAMVTCGLTLACGLDPAFGRECFRRL